jgi:hypothetical protein
VAHKELEMSRNGSGTYTLPAGNPVVTGTTISSTWANNTLTDIATALTGSLAADGQTTATGNLKMGSNRITGLANGIAATDAATKSQVDAAVAGLGTMATQNANAVAVTGGAVDGTTIGATTPSTVKTTALTVTGSTSGTLAIAATAVAGTNTATFPAATGTVMVSGNMPAFSAYQSSAQTLSSSTNTKITFTTEEFDTANCFASSRFTPNVAGYYQFSTAIQMGVLATAIILDFYKNGTLEKRVGQTNSSVVSLISGSALIYCNGSTDYVEVYAQLGTGQALDASSSRVYFQGVMVRAA